MELSTVLKQVRSLVNLAEHENTPPAEAQLAREKADALMLKYAIDQAQLEAAKPIADRGKPEFAEFPTASDMDIAAKVGWMMGVVAQHTRCKIRAYTRYDQEQRCWMSTVYGYESDLRYFEILYTTLRLHMLGVLRPRPQADLSDDENAYRLHSAGYNWLEIAEMYGWRKVPPSAVTDLRYDGKVSDELYDRFLDGKAEVWHNRNTDEYKTNWQIGSYWKRACQRAAAKRGETHTRISAGGSSTYRTSAADGYVSRIHRRLRDTQAARAGAGELVLANRERDLEDFVRETNPSAYTRCPECQKLSANPYECDRCGHHIADPPPTARECERCKKARSGYCRAHSPGPFAPRPFSSEGYSAGVAHANTADISPNRFGSGRKQELS